MHSVHIDMVNKKDHGNLVKYAGDNRTEIMKLSEMLKSALVRIEFLENEVSDVKGKCEKLEGAEKTKTVSMSESWVTIASKNRKQTQDQITVINALTHEQAERKKRENNIIVSGVVPSTKETEEERKAEDESIVKEIIKKTGGLDAKLDVYIKRLQTNKLIEGKPSDIRIDSIRILVLFNNIEDKMQVLRNSNKLKSESNFENVYLNHDRTSAEMQRDYELRTECRKRNNENKEAYFFFGIRGNLIAKIRRK